MVKKSLLYIFIIGAMAVIIYGMTGSGAWFSDAASASGAISSGNFDLEVTGQPLEYSKLEPGAKYKPVGEFCVKNNGDYDMKFRGYMKDVDDPGHLLDYLLIKIVIKALNEEDHNNYGPQDEDVVLDSDIPFTDLMDWNDVISLTPDDDDNPEPFAPGMKACYQVFAKISGDAGNDQISKTLTADLYLNATQWINAGW